MYGTTTALAQIVATAGNLGFLLGVAVGTVMTGWVGLIALGFLKSKLSRHVLGTNTWHLEEDDGLDKVWRKGNKMRVTRGGSIRDEWDL